MSYNTRIQSFPDMVMANMFSFVRFEFFEAEEEAREVPEVSFSQPPAEPPTAPPTAPPSASGPPASPPEA